MFILIMHMFIRAGHNVLTGKSNEKNAVFVKTEMFYWIVSISSSQ